MAVLFSIFFIIAVFFSIHLQAQNNTVVTGKNSGADLFGTNSRFVENIGQYGNTFKGYDNMGKVLYGYEGLNMPVLME